MADTQTRSVSPPQNERTISSDEEKVVDTPRESHAEEDEIIHLIGVKGLGVQRIEAVSAQFTKFERIALYVSIFIVAYAYGLDGTIRYTYQVCAGFPLPNSYLFGCEGW
jgi:hypothetical protein